MPFVLQSLCDNPDIPLDKPIVLVGRHQECDVQIHSRKISRKHCCIAQVNDYVVVRDLFSTNGVSINGKRVDEGSLRPGDELSIAHFRYQVTVTGRDAPATMHAEADLQSVVYDDKRNGHAGPATEKSLRESDSEVQ